MIKLTNILDFNKSTGKSTKYYKAASLQHGLKHDTENEELHPGTMW